MAVRIIRVQHEGKPRWGVARDGAITLIHEAYGTTGELLRAVTPASLRALDGPAIDEASARLLPPVTPNQQFLCQGLNYRQHMIESGMDPDAKTFNMIFTKASSCLTAADGKIVRPAHVSLLDYEIELGLVLGRDLTAPASVRPNDLLDFVAAVTIVNDVSARDVQLPQGQFYKGKSYRSFGPVGPYLCLLEPEDLPRLSDLRLELRVNGEVRQADSTANLVFGPAETITELSGLQDLFAGDLIATGTPAGCGLRLPSPRIQRFAHLLPDRVRWRKLLEGQAKRAQYLKPGDRVESRIISGDGRLDLGVQRNLVVEAAD